MGEMKREREKLDVERELCKIFTYLLTIFYTYIGKKV